MANVTTAILIALLCTSCLGSAMGIGLTAVVMNRYNDIPPDGRKGDTRFADYEQCAAVDNTSWDVLDAAPRRATTVIPTILLASILDGTPTWRAREQTIALGISTPVCPGRDTA